MVLVTSCSTLKISKRYEATNIAPPTGPLFETDPAYRMYRMYTYDSSSTHHEEYVEDYKRKLGALRPAAQASLPPGSSPHVPPSVAGQSLPSIRLQQQGLLPAGIIPVF